MIKTMGRMLSWAMLSDSPNIHTYRAFYHAVCVVKQRLGSRYNSPGHKADTLHSMVHLELQKQPVTLRIISVFKRGLSRVI